MKSIGNSSEIKYVTRKLASYPRLESTGRIHPLWVLLRPGSRRPIGTSKEISMYLGHRIQFHDTSTWSRNQDIWNVSLGKTQLHPENMNSEEGFSLSRSWKPLIQTLKQREKVLSKDKRFTVPEATFYTRSFRASSILTLLPLTPPLVALIDYLTSPLPIGYSCTGCPTSISTSSSTRFLACI